MSKTERVTLLKETPRGETTELYVKRHVNTTLDMLVAGVDPTTLPPNTIPTSFSYKENAMSKFTGSGAGAGDDEKYVPSPSHPGDSYYEIRASGNETSFGMKVNGVEVTHITPGGWADKNGVKLDDEISEVSCSRAVGGSVPIVQGFRRVC